MGFSCRPLLKVKNVFKMEPIFTKKTNHLSSLQKSFCQIKLFFLNPRYFQSGKVEKNFFYWNKKRIHVLICEDLWRNPPIQKPDLIISLNASPYTNYKQENRFKKVKEFTKKYHCPSIYLNCVGAQDSLIFDGGSFALNHKGNLLWQGDFFKPDFKILNIFEKTI